MDTYKRKSVCIIDNGLFCGLAERLAKDFGHVYYWSPWIRANVNQVEMRVGMGLPGVERIDYWEPLLEEEDLLWVFPDCYYGPMQVMLVKLEKRVWGSRMAEELELYREASKKHLKSLGIPIGKYTELGGTEALRRHSKANKKQRFKRSFTRGDMETQNAPRYELVEDWITSLEHKLGPEKFETRFIAEDSIEDAVEIGYDGPTVHGQFPKQAFWGIEYPKSQCYIGRVTAFDKMPSQITDNLQKIAPTLEEYEACTWFGFETRVTKDGTPWVIDPLARLGNPPGSLVTWKCRNIADVFWQGAEGVCVDPDYEEPWGVQLQIHCPKLKEMSIPVFYPKEVEENVVLVNAAVFGGTRYVLKLPEESTTIGAVIATGKTMNEAAEKAREIAKQVEGLDLEIATEVLDEGMKEVGRLEEYGLKM